MKKYLYIFIILFISSGVSWAQSGWWSLFWFVLVLPFLVFVTFPAVILTITSSKRFTVVQTAQIKHVLTVLLTALFVHHLLVPVLTDSELSNGVVVFPSNFMNTPPPILQFLSTIFVLSGILMFVASTIVLIIKLVQYRKVSRFLS